MRRFASAHWLNLDFNVMMIDASTPAPRFLSFPTIPAPQGLIDPAVLFGGLIRRMRLEPFTLTSQNR